MASTAPRLLRASTTLQRPLQRRLVASSLPRRALEDRNPTVAHGDPAAPLDEARDAVERQAIAQARQEGDQGTVRPDMFDQSRDFSRWRYFSLAGGILLILAYQEFLIDDKRFPVAGYDLDRREEWDNSLDNYRLYQLFKRILVRTGMDPTERLQLHADQLVDDVHGGRITKTWNSYDKPLARYSDHASRPFTDIIGHVPQNFPITRDGLQIRTEQAWLHRPPTKAEQEQSGGEEEGSDEGEQGGNEEGGEQGGEEKQEEGGESEE